MRRPLRIFGWVSMIAASILFPISLFSMLPFSLHDGLLYCAVFAVAWFAWLGFVRSASPKPRIEPDPNS